jgi:arginyl-tRNA synthetase
MWTCKAGQAEEEEQEEKKVAEEMEGRECTLAKRLIAWEEVEKNVTRRSEVNYVRGHEKVQNGSVCN